MMKGISDIAGGPGQPCSKDEREKFVPDGAVHNTQGEVTQKPRFQKGHAKMGGRKKGSQNRVTRDVKEAILEAGERIGSDGKGKDGLVGAVMGVYRRKPEAWMAALAKLIPNNHRVTKTETMIAYQTLEQLQEEMRQVGLEYIEDPGK
jgi:hypothetical protein